VKNSSMNYVHKVMPEVIDILNPEQRECVQKVLEAKDYVLVRGLPGSGMYFYYFNHFDHTDPFIIRQNRNYSCSG